MSDLAHALTSTGAIPPGTRLGKYEVVGRLGGGGMAEIYVARAHEAAGVMQWAVIKRVLPHLARDPEFIRMFLNEAKITASLHHPHIAHVKEVGRAGDEFFLALEFIHGVDLKRILRESAPRGGVPLGPALTIIAAAADALHYAHGRGIVHRDVTPSNIMVSYEGHTKVLDFGIAKAALTATTRAGTIKGKVGYMSPEQCMAETVDGRSDVFALGVLLYESTLGKRLFRGDSDFAIMNQITLGRLVHPSRVAADYPEALERIVLQALAVDPADRFQTAQAFGQALEDFAREHGVRTSPAEVATWLRSLLGEPPPPISTAELDAFASATPTRVVATTWSLPGEPRRSRTLAIGLLGGALGIAIGAVTVGVLQRSAPEAASRPAEGSGSAAPSVAPTASPAAAASVPDATPPSPDAARSADVADDAIATPTPAPVAPEPMNTAAQGAVEADPAPLPPRRGSSSRRRASAKTKRTAASGSSLLPPSRGGTR